MLKNFPANITFKYPWRKYQQRVLDELSVHLENEHLHVIAPPGSGKTVLGLEVMLRLGHPVLIVSPTLAIRNQWVERFCELFLQEDQVPDWISEDVKNPGLMTVVTYQGLHAAAEESRLPTLLKKLREAGVKTIIADEAHHLKNEWWQTLNYIKKELNPSFVGLTATPPYDSTPVEWNRYIDLNGPIDVEIAVPELIAEGDLCPHQDYIYFSFPSEDEQEKLRVIYQNIHQVFLELKNDSTLIQAIETYPVYQTPETHLEWIYDHLNIYASFLIFLHETGREIPEIHLEVLGDKKMPIPVLDYKWMETVLDFYLNKGKDHFIEQQYEEHMISMENKLKRYGVIEQKQIRLSDNNKIAKILGTSIGKMNAVTDIVNFEYRQMGKDLRMVILSDFIRNEFLSDTTIPLSKIGVVPIFEKLRRENTNEKKLGVLTGTLVIIPVSAISAFEDRAETEGLEKLSFCPLGTDENYVIVPQTEQLKHVIVSVVTHIFQQGEIEVLIGTKSLLGEGWDAPAINALILASFVGSFVLSNQMRGRAIRTQRNNGGKTGNIWHLVCVDPHSLEIGDDLNVLARRFRGFVGISYFDDLPSIQNGIKRLQIPQYIRSREEANTFNKKTFMLAADRPLLEKRWKNALHTGISLVNEIKVPFQEEKPFKEIKEFHLRKTVAFAIGEFLSALFAFGEFFFREFFTVHRSHYSWWFPVMGLIGCFIFGRKMYRAGRLYFKYRDITNDIQKIGEVLLDSLWTNNNIRSRKEKLEVITSSDASGTVYCHLNGAENYEKLIFIKALQEIVGPVVNPRYVIIRKSRRGFIITQRDYHSVPEVLGQKKTSADYFRRQWENQVGKCELVYTRNIAGRKTVLKARIKSLAAQFDRNKEVEIINKWG